MYGMPRSPIEFTRDNVKEINFEAMARDVVEAMYRLSAACENIDDCEDPELAASDVVGPMLWQIAQFCAMSSAYIKNEGKIDTDPFGDDGDEEGGES